MKKGSSQAFSLIELSIVILVIGILIAGTLQGSIIVKQARLSSARSITESSPVSSIDGLALWLETTSEKSFLKFEAEDGVHLSRWEDINPQSSFKYHALKTASEETVYKENSPIGNLPSIYFNGTASVNSYFTLSTTTSVSDATYIDSPYNNFTYFIVGKLDEISNSENHIYTALINGSEDKGINYSVEDFYDYSGKRLIQSVVGTKSLQPATTNAEIISVTNKYTLTDTDPCPGIHYLGKATLYVNGSSETLTDSSNTNTNTCPTWYSTLTIGGRTVVGENFYWKGYISEIIIYSKVLSNLDRKSIEKYLGQKYNIKVSS